MLITKGGEVFYFKLNTMTTNSWLSATVALTPIIKRINATGRKSRQVRSQFANRKIKKRTMEKFKQLVSLCKSSVEISVNDHKDVYESVEQYIDEVDRKDIDIDVFSEMVKRNTIVRVQAYPYSPNGFFIVYHYDIDKAVEISLLKLEIMF